MSATTADDLRTNLTGAWVLQSYEARSIDGSDVTYPLGVNSRGIIMYTPDGYIVGPADAFGPTAFQRR